MMPGQHRRRFAHFLLLVLCLFAAKPGLAAVSPPVLTVVASFSILGDFAQRIGGERVRVHTLIGAGADAHVFQPTPADGKTLAQASLVVVNGLGFEGWIERLIKSSGYRGKVLVASAGVAALKQTAAHAHSGHPRGTNGDQQDGQAFDPHAWQDMKNALRYVDNIAQGLGEADPAGKALYQANAAHLKREIAALDVEIRQMFDKLPPERRKVVTSHDAFAYFSRAYGIRFISAVGISTDAEPSAADLGRIIRLIRKERTPAIFMENVSDPRLLQRIQAESGARVGGTLYPDALSTASGPAHTYLKMMRHNAQSLATALAY